MPERGRQRDRDECISLGPPKLPNQDMTPLCMSVCVCLCVKDSGRDSVCVRVHVSAPEIKGGKSEVSLILIPYSRLCACERVRECVCACLWV